MKREDCILFSGAAAGAEAEFGAQAAKTGIDEVNFSFEGRKVERTRGLRILTHEELRNGDVSMVYVSRLMNRRYSDSPTFRKILQTIWHQINSGQEIFVIGQVLPDDTVKGGTGWGAEFAKLCNKPLHVFDQDKNAWFSWNEKRWVEQEGNELSITSSHFTGTGTRSLNENGKQAIQLLFERSFKV